MSATIDLITYSDADLARSFHYQLVDGTPINITGWIFHLMVRRQADDPTVEFECTTENGRVWINDAATGAFTLQIPISVLSVLIPGTYAQSLIATVPVSMLRKDIWRGSLMHSAGPTRWPLGTP
jgi:hypothetical protein